MAEGYPRSSRNDRSLRKRSGVYRKNAQVDVSAGTSTLASSSSVVSRKTHGVSTVDNSVSHSRPGPFTTRASILKDAPLPPLPNSSPNPNSNRYLDPDNISHYEQHEHHAQPFIDVPLTPSQRSLDLERDGNFSGLDSYLPTPDFSRQNSVRSRLSVSEFLTTASRPGNRKDSSSAATLRTGADAWKSDTDTLTRARPSLIPTQSSNWTQKWPKPRLNPRSLGGLVAAIEESEGLGFDKPDKWTPHKWVLLMTILISFGYSSVGLGYAMLTWFRGWEHAEVMYTADADILVYITVAGSIQIFTSLVGLCGGILNSRPILAVYSLLLWPSFISLVIVGYTSYKRSEFALHKKLNLAWSKWYNPGDRLVIQGSLGCCGYYNPLHQVVSSKRCFPRTTLPGCKANLYLFEKENLRMIWSTAFSLVPLHVIVICISLICSNHVTETFGKGIVPKKYRLGLGDVQSEAESVGQGVFRDKSEFIRRPGGSKEGFRRTLREDRA